MRVVLNVVGVVMILLGSVWILQGINLLRGSFMSGQMQWAVRGGILALVGIGLVSWVNRKKEGAV
jgi:hypothetical protein